MGHVLTTFSYRCKDLCRVQGLYSRQCSSCQGLWQPRAVSHGHPQTSKTCSPTRPDPCIPLVLPW